MNKESDNGFSNTFSVSLELEVNVDYVMFGAYKCKSKAVRFLKSGVYIVCMADTSDNDIYDSEDDSEKNDESDESCEEIDGYASDVPFVRVMYKDMIDFRYCDDEQTLIVVIKPDNQWIRKFRCNSMAYNGVKCGIKFDYEFSENQYVIIKIEKTSIKFANSGDDSPNVFQLLDAFFAFLKCYSQLKICDKSETEETKKLLDYVMNLSRVRELTKENGILRQMFNRDRETVRSRSETTIRLKIDNFSKINAAMKSSASYARNLLWTLIAKPITHEENGEQYKTLGLYLQSRSDSGGDYSCDVSGEFRLIPQKVGIACFSKRLRFKFTATKTTTGYAKYHNWNDIMKEERGYISGDTVLLEVWFLGKI